MTLTHWPEDQVGKKIEPRPIDWSTWRTDNENVALDWVDSVPNGGLHQQFIALLGDIATTDQVMAAKQKQLDAAWISSGVSVGKYKQAILDLTAIQHDYSRASLQASMGVQTFNPAVEAAKELNANIKAGLVPLDQANNAMTAYVKKWTDLGEQAQVAGSKFPQLTQFALDAGNLNKQLDALSVGGLQPLSTEFINMEETA